MNSAVGLKFKSFLGLTRKNIKYFSRIWFGLLKINYKFKIYRLLLPSRRIFVSNLTQNARFINPNAQNIYKYVILRS